MNVNKAVAPPERAAGLINADTARTPSAGGHAVGPGPGGRSARGQMLFANTLAYLLLALGAVLFMLPFLYLVGTALKSAEETNEFPPRLFPRAAVSVTTGGATGRLALVKSSGTPVQKVAQSGDQWTVQPLDDSLRATGERLSLPASNLRNANRLDMVRLNFSKALTTIPFGRFFLNTLLIVACTVLGSTLSAALCAYGFARLRFRLRDPLFIVLLATMMIPGQVTMIPVYILFKELHWINTYLPLIVPAWFGGGAFSIFLLRQFFQSIPYEMEEAARIDGCGPLTTWWRVVLPLSFPALATVGIFTFMGAWNDFMGPLIYLNDTDKFTLALGLNLFKGQYGTDTPHLMMAATLVVLLPVLVLFFVAQKQFIQGIVVSGVKG